MKRWEAFNEISEKPESFRSQALGIFAYSIIESAGVDTENITFENLEEVYNKIESWLNEPVETVQTLEEYVENMPMNVNI